MVMLRACTCSSRVGSSGSSSGSAGSLRRRGSGRRSSPPTRGCSHRERRGQSCGIAGRAAWSWLRPADPRHRHGSWLCAHLRTDSRPDAKHPPIASDERALTRHGLSGIPRGPSPTRSASTSAKAGWSPNMVLLYVREHPDRRNYQRPTRTFGSEDSRRSTSETRRVD